MHLILSIRVIRNGGQMMAFEYPGKSALRYQNCHYGGSKLEFRGPKRRLNQPYIAVIGGSETYGKFLEQPYPAILEHFTGICTVNLGSMYAGIDIFLSQPAVLDICSQAATTIVELTGAQNMNNRFYSVHPRRNDRFLGANDLLKSIYPSVDFTDIHFTGHLLSVLQKHSESRFQMVQDELRADWQSKMQQFLDRIGGNVILLWMSDRKPDRRELPDSGSNPMFIDRDLIAPLLGLDRAFVEVIATPDEISAGHERMVFSQFEEAAARQMLGPVVHQEAARSLLDAVTSINNGPPNTARQ